MPDESLLPLTPNQLVAYNLRRARELRGWSQEQAITALTPFVGARWSKAVYSAAERSVTGVRRRNFDADDLLAFARAFKLPITYFLLPPDANESQLSTPDEPDGLPPTLILDHLYRPDVDERHRVEQLCSQLAAETHYQGAILDRSRAYLAALVRNALEQHRTITPAALRSLAHLLENAGPDNQLAQALLDQAKPSAET